MFLIKIIVFSVVVIVGVLFFTLYRNDANLFDAPGLQQRLTIFLTTNQAETKDDHVFKELTTPVYNVGAEKLYQRVINAATELSWSIESSDIDNQNANFVVSSPVFLFEDDIFVQVQFLNMDQSSLYIRSSSRKGRGDLAANSSHIQQLIKELQ